MDADQTASLEVVWSGFKVLASVIKFVLSAFEYMQQMNKQTTSISRIRVKSYSFLYHSGGNASGLHIKWTL